jgi:hypothetical protein
VEPQACVESFCCKSGSTRKTQPCWLAPHTKKREKHRETTKEKEKAHEENTKYSKQKGEDEQIPCGLIKSYTKSLRKH